MTIKDIAKHCGVSVSTVSRVLNNHPYVSADVRSKVLDFIDQVHFVPHASAVDLVKHESDAIGLVIRGISNPFFTEIIPTIEHAIDAAGYTLIEQHIHTQDDELRTGAMLARAKRLKGLLFLGGCFDYLSSDIEMLDVPFVCCSFSNRFGELPDNAYSSVTINDQQEACKAVDELIKRGHKKIAVILGSTCDHSISELRYRGYCQALEKNNIKLDKGLVEETGDFGMEAAYQSTMKLLKRRTDFTAIFAIADAMGVAAIKALHDFGLSVPKDCSLIAIDGITMSEYSVPTLSTLVQPKAELGEKAVQMLLGMVEKSSGNSHLVLDTALREGGTLYDLT